MVVDTSALLAIIQNEPESEQFLAAIRAADRVLASAVTILEAGTVLHARRGTAGTDELIDLVDGMGIDVVAFDALAAHAAVDAFRTYGKGIHAQVRLNLGDCAVYALAKSMNAPLLFKGHDFAATDIASAVR